MENKQMLMFEMCLFGAAVCWYLTLSDIGEASLQNPQNVAQNEMVVILDYNLLSLIKLQ